MPAVVFVRERGEIRKNGFNETKKKFKTRVFRNNKYPHLKGWGIPLELG